MTELATFNRQRLTGRDFTFMAVCILLAGSAVILVGRYFAAAFPQASIEFRYDRNTSRSIAEKMLFTQAVDIAGMKHAVRFDADDQARIFLERSLGLDSTQVVLRDQIRVWSWHHRWFQPLVEEELSVDVAPTGEIIGYSHKLPEARVAGGMARPLVFLRTIGVRDALTLVSTSQRKLPNRIQRIFTFESKTIRPAGAPYRHVVTIDGDIVTGYTQQLKVPDTWLRSYRELRSKNSAAGSIDTIFMVLTMIAAVVVFIARLRQGDIPLRFLLAIAIAAVVLGGAVALNSMPSQLAWYDTATSYPAFVGQLAFGAAVQSIGTAVLLIVICGSGEVLYRKRLPQHLAIPRLWTRKALTSKRVFLSIILGYALVPLFIAYQVVFYLVAHRFGAWAPAEVPYDDTLNTAFPWVAVLFAGFFPAFSEEFMSRAFSIPFLQRIVRWRWLAIVAAAFIWGFGHATYPNQPFWIRGVEVGIAGIVAGFVMDRFGLLPLLLWHYTIDAVYTATLLFASGNTYYVVSAAVSSLIFAVPLLVSIALYVRNRGFVPDDDLTNATLPVSETVPREARATTATPFPDPLPLPSGRVILCLALVAAAVAAIALRPPSPRDAVDYRISKEEAKRIATEHVCGAQGARRRAPSSQPCFQRVIALPVEGFRSWDRDSGREDGGAPGDFDDVAAAHLLRQGMSIEQLTKVFRDRIEAGTWMVRFFTPRQKEEIFVEIDPRTSKAIGYHRYVDEEAPGPTLAQDQALAIARGEFATYGLDPNAFEVKESLTFAQPRRGDWLFHFDEKTPLVPGAFRRVTVRVAGASVSQFSKTVKVPEIVYREAATETLLNVVLLILKILGSVTLLALVIAGLVFAGRRHGLPWRRALRWTLILAVIPLVNIAARYESSLFGYSTSVAWETFRVSLITHFVADAGLQIGLIFLALAGLEAAVPYALSLGTRESRNRFGKSAAVAALTALSVLVIVDAAGTFVAAHVPGAAAVEISAPEQVGLAFPGLLDAGTALTLAIVASAAIVLYSLALPRHTALVTIAALFCAALDPSATPGQTPLMMVRVLVFALLAWTLARYVLGRNPLAWPLFVFLLTTLQTASLLLRNHRPDLRANGIALLVLAAMAVIWTASSSWGASSQRRDGTPEHPTR
ncbi:MAG: CPBP family intramembrane glutamic endopeptidase [Acidobacteriota bacterium]